MALELHVDIDVMMEQWDKAKFERWYAFFTLREERSRKKQK